MLFNHLVHGNLLNVSVVCVNRGQKDRRRLSPSIGLEGEA